ncbi:conserved hypothetical protein [Candidatus Caldarchaeum subterraneum]|uniref:CopG family transcriptional regulator n=1 Tax=Caldiarchaeum subterraneum TaxID=311458 RepID=E6N469_CALS0|nr:conserved hypothetical protein [Candidatus Caldarchaeum subterraneum]BAJ49917.1 conserved hypothetical protein [Candidatus Caldarchaeum subterraneum]
MRNYSTISVPNDVKKTLEKDKGSREWGEYLLELYKEATETRKKRALENLAKLLSEKELNNILEESRRFRREFKLR